MTHKERKGLKKKIKNKGKMFAMEGVMLV